MANIAFTRIIRVSERQLEFNFRKLPGEYHNYHADVTDHKGDRIQFSMYQDAHGNWRSTGNLLPLWIANEEKTIGEAIQDEISAMSSH